MTNIPGRKDRFNHSHDEVRKLSGFVFGSWSANPGAISMMHGVYGYRQPATIRRSIALFDSIMAFELVFQADESGSIAPPTKSSIEHLLE
jgi:hypothetical protein